VNPSALTIQVQADVIGCADHTFHGWAREGLVWLPERGMGFLEVTEQPYDAEYFEKYAGYAATEMGRAITESRLALVLRHINRGSAVVDVGIGSGHFLEAAGELLPFLGGYDVNPAGIAWLNARGLFRDPRRVPVDVLTFWDVLEHIPDPATYLVRAREWVFCSLPIVPGDGPPPLDWKHLRRDEHVWYWTHDGFIAWMAEKGFDLEEFSYIEVQLGREDIGTFAFRRSARWS
jgi:hypothetical protein